MTTLTATDSSGWTLIVAERARQITDEGWLPHLDDRHANGELRTAAECYRLAVDDRMPLPSKWPWSPDWWKPRDRASNLRRSGALLLAEADRLTRAGRPASAETVRAEARAIAEGLTRLLAASTTRPTSSCPTPEEHP